MLGRGCVCGSNIFLQDGGRKILEKKEKKLYTAFMDLETAYDRVDWLSLWEVLRIYGVGGKLLSAIKSFYERHLHVSKLMEKQVNILR